MLKHFQLTKLLTKEFLPLILAAPSARDFWQLFLFHGLQALQPLYPSCSLSRTTFSQQFTTLHTTLLTLK